MKRIEVTIDGMSCGHCVSAVQTALKAIPGVELDAVEVGRARFGVSSDQALADAREAIEDEGYLVLEVNAQA
jgi:copper chaperone CopZ